MKSGKEINANFLLLSLGIFVQNLYAVIDSSMVARLGQSSLAFVGVAGSVLNTLFAFPMGLSTAVQASFGGCSNSDGNQKLIRVTLFWGLFVGIVTSGLVVLFTKGIVGGLVVGDHEEFVTYVYLKALSVFLFSITSALSGIYLGCGQIRVWLKVLGLCLTASLGVNFLLVSHSSPLFLGVIGTGLASVAGSAVAVVAYLILIPKVIVPGFGKRLERIQIDRNAGWGLIGKTIGVSFQYFIFNLGTAVFMFRVNDVGSKMSALLTVILELESFLLVPAMAFGILTLNLSRDSLMVNSRTYRELIQILKKSVAVCALIGVILNLWPGQIISLFPFNQTVMTDGIVPIRILGFLLPMDAIRIVLMNAFHANGLLSRSLIVSFGTQWIFFLPLVWLFSSRFGEESSLLWLIVIAWRALQCLLCLAIWIFPQVNSFSSSFLRGFKREAEV